MLPTIIVKKDDEKNMYGRTNSIILHRCPNCNLSHNSWRIIKKLFKCLRCDSVFKREEIVKSRFLWDEKKLQ